MWRIRLCGMLLCSALYALASAGQLPGDALLERGRSAARQGALEEALVAWKEAAQEYAQIDHRQGQIQALLHAAAVARTLGHLNQSFLHLELALQLAHRTGEQQWVTLALSELGKTALVNRQFEQATEYVTGALAMAQTQRHTVLTASLHNELGLVRVLQGQLQDALASFHESAALAEAAGFSALRIRALINGAGAAIRLRQFDEGEAALNATDALLSGSPVSYEKAEALINLALGYRHLALSHPTARDRALSRSATLLQQAANLTPLPEFDRIASYAYGYLGQLYETDHRLEEALSLTRRAIFAAQAARAPESLYRWQWQSGRLLTRLGQLDDALSAYHAAAATVQPIRLEIAAGPVAAPDPDQPSLRTLYFELADVLLKRAALSDDDRTAEPYVRAARDAIEAYKAVELRDYFRDDCVDRVQSRITELDRLSPSTAIIYPIVFGDRTELVVSDQDGLRRLAVPVTASALTEEVRRFRHRLEKRTTREYLPHAQRLYDWLLRPLTERLDTLHVDTLVFVLDGPLRTIPMAALHDGERFLISRYAVAVTPSVNLTDPRPIDRTRAQLLSSGLTKAVQGYPPLPHVAEEVAYIHSLFKGEQLLDKSFIAPRIETELQDGRYGILHIATHGRFATDITQSFLVTFDGKLTMSQLERLVGLFRFREDPLELLTLSACQTGVGDEQAALGLAGIAIKAGARSALATLWFINDDASKELVSEFYRQLHDTALSKAQALQRAQLKLLDDRVYGHPAYWAAFLLLNNWL